MVKTCDPWTGRILPEMDSLEQREWLGTGRKDNVIALLLPVQASPWVVHFYTLTLLDAGVSNRGIFQNFRTQPRTDHCRERARHQQSFRHEAAIPVFDLILCWKPPREMLTFAQKPQQVDPQKPVDFENRQVTDHNREVRLARPQDTSGRPMRISSGSADFGSQLRFWPLHPGKIRQYRSG